VYARFDNKSSGRKTLSATPSSSPELQNVVRIAPHEDALTGRNVVRRQLPLKLGWAATIHKVQRMTTLQVVISLEKIF
jgi:hypothetical protein